MKCSSVVQVMACRLFHTKSFLEPVLPYVVELYGTNFIEILTEME